MSETIVSNETPVKSRILELYMISCQQISTLKSQLLQKQYQEALITFQKFRINVTEIYYLARTIEDIKDDEIMKKVKKWSSLNCGKRPSIKFYNISIRLFEDFSELLVSRGGIV